MKKPVKVPRKTNSQKKKTAAKPARTPRKKKKVGYSDAVRAFFMVGVLVVLSASISLAVIMVHSTLKNSRQIDIEHELPPPVTVEPENTKPIPIEPDVKTNPPASAPPKPSASVSVQQPAQKRTETAPATAPSATRTAPTAQKPREDHIENLGTLVFVIDDAGNNLRELEPFLRIPAPLTIAVLPGLPHSAEAARRIRAAGKEVFLHQPMEALGAQNPGPGAIYSGMNAGEIRSILSRNVAEIGPVAGINNHQGSKVTMDREAVETILAFCAEHGLYFLDSRTTAETVVPSAARQMGMKIAERDVFIDNEQDKDSMLSYITGGLARARKNGSAVMIGHTWSPALAPLLAEQFPLFTKQGYTIKTASDIIK